MCEKFNESKKVPVPAVMDLEKTFDRVEREVLWQVLEIYGAGGNTLAGMKSLYELIALV